MDTIRKTKILQVCGGLSTEGIGVFLLNTFENINQNKFVVDFAVATKYQQTFENRIKNKGGKILRTYEIGDGPLGKIMHSYNLYKIIRLGKYDVVHSHMDFFNGINLLIAFIAGARMRISHAHVSAIQSNTFIKKMYYIIMRSFITLFATERIGCSQNANKLINKHGTIILNGIDLDKFTPYTTVFPEEIALNNKKRLITVGRISDVKNPFFLVDIINELSYLRKDFVFYWIGSGSLDSAVKNIIKEKKLNEYCKFLGVKNNIYNYLPLMDLFILPSKHEAFPTVLLEAQAAGLVCVISDKITDSINYGLCNKISLKEGPLIWAKQINKFLNDKKFEKQLSNLEQVDIKNTIKILENVYLNP